MVKSVKTSNKKILTFVKKKECQAASLTPSTLGMLFEIYAGVKYDAEDATTRFSRAITVEELEKIHPNFRIISGNPRQFNYRDVSVWFFKSIKILPATF